MVRSPSPRLRELPQFTSRRDEKVNGLKPARFQSEPGSLKGTVEPARNQTYKSQFNFFYKAIATPIDREKGAINLASSFVRGANRRRVTRTKHPRERGNRSTPRDATREIESICRRFANWRCFSRLSRVKRTGRPRNVVRKRKKKKKKRKTAREISLRGRKRGILSPGEKIAGREKKRKK